MDDNRMCGGSNVLQEPFQELFGESVAEKAHCN